MKTAFGKKTKMKNELSESAVFLHSGWPSVRNEDEETKKPIGGHPCKKWDGKRFFEEAEKTQCTKYTVKTNTKSTSAAERKKKKTDHFPTELFRPPPEGQKLWAASGVLMKT